MKLIKLLRNLEAQLHIQIQHNEALHLLFVPLATLCGMAIVIWLAGPFIYAPLMSTEKRFYLILVLFLAWLIKFLLVDLEAPNPYQHKNAAVRKKLLELQNRFRGAVKFINTATTTRHGQTTNLKKLPWYLLLGPSCGGKTTLLANADVHYILQRHFPHHDLNSLAPTENLDWWITREASIIDIPGKYLSTNRAAKNAERDVNINPLAWKFFLHLIKKQRGNHGMNGIIIALPIAEIMKQNDAKQYHALLKNLFQRIQEVQSHFSRTIPCYLLVTKCDLVPGFSEFFAESSHEETGQAWGVALPSPKKNEKLSHLFSVRFDALIKKMNQQLLWRLHQERNPMLRPYIKDFPLQIERMKEFLLDFTNKFSSAQLNTPLQGIYLTSALQINAKEENTVLEHNTTARDVQIFKLPAGTSRAFFIKQFLTQALAQPQVERLPLTTSMQWAHRSVYALTVSVVTLTIVLLGLDFQRGIEQTQLVKTQLAAYQASALNAHSPSEHLSETIHLFNTLTPKEQSIESHHTFWQFFSFYSRQSLQKTHALYQQAMRTILIPEIKNYLEDYLTMPVNKNADDVYAALKAYLMLGDTAYFNPNHITAIMWKILPASVQPKDKDDLAIHLTTALQSAWSPIALNTQKITDTRAYLMSLPSAQLGYIILKNLDNNNTVSNIRILPNIAFASSQAGEQVPVMFTAQSYPFIITQESALAAQEAIMGNWVLGKETAINKSPMDATLLAEQLRNMYIKHYIDTWENLLEDLHLSNAQNLMQIDTMIVNLINADSPLLTLLNTLHDNTFFDPIASSSIKLQSLGVLVEKNPESQNLLYEIFSGLQTLHVYLQSVITAENQRLAAFRLVSNRMLAKGEPDAITQLRMVADKSPKPIKTWLNKLADDSWQFLMQDAGHYLDTSWQNKVIHYYHTDIAQRYPFDKTYDKEVDIQKFKQFFGNPGIIIGYYNQYLQNFVDTSTADWHWKKVDGKTLPFSEETLRQIQQAVRIHYSFFPNHDNNLFVRFTMQPYEFGDLIKMVKLSINNKQFIDEKDNLNNAHTITWPTNNEDKMTWIQMTMMDENTVRTNFPGHWGWLKLINKSFESMLNKKEMVVNLSLNQHPVKYILATEGKYNPFLGLNLSQFRLPQQLTDEKA